MRKEFALLAPMMLLASCTGSPVEPPLIDCTPEAVYVTPEITQLVYPEGCLEERV